MIQAGAPSQLWGAATPGSSIVVAAEDVSVKLQATSNSTGQWQVEWPSLPFRRTAFAISIKATYPNGGTDQIMLSDMLIGDVIVCSGQSNMQFPLELALNASAAIQTATLPLLRILQVATPPEYVNASKPQNNATMSIRWSVATPENVPRFSGECFFAGRDMMLAVPEPDRRPLGMIESCLGGSYIESWMSGRALAKCPGSTDQPHFPPAQTTALWYSKIWPLLPLSIRAVLWDQGESNIFQPDLYQCELPTMVQDWRAWWRSKARPHGPALPSLDQFPFAYRQLHAYPSGGAHGPMRIGMAAVEHAAPHMGYYPTYDIGNMTSPWGNIHFPDKQEAGRRAALLLRGLLQQQGNGSDVRSSGDREEDAHLRGTGPGTEGLQPIPASSFLGPQLANVTVVSYGNPNITHNKRFFAVDLTFSNAGP